MQTEKFLMLIEYFFPYIFLICCLSIFNTQLKKIAKHLNKKEMEKTKKEIYELEQTQFL